MLKFTKTDDCLQTQCMPNLLPCRIHHEGPVDASPRYWAPERAKGNIIDGNLESYFRGRKLRGQELDLPQGYRGVIVKEVGKETCLQNRDKGELDGEEGEEEQEEATLLKEVGSFEKIVVWNHESMVNGDDAFVKGVSEWIDFAEAVSSLPITYPGPMTVADKTYRLDACTSRKESVKMDIESFRFLQCELEAQKGATSL